MLQYHTKRSIIFSIFPAIMAMIVALAGCTDDFVNTVDIPDVEVEIKGDLIFKPFVTTQVQTRTDAPEGPEYKGIKSLYLFFFNEKRELSKEYSGYVSFTPVPSEGSTHEHVTFKKHVRAGRYYVYAVANISEDLKDKLPNIKTIENLKTLKVKWDDHIAEDLEMFGVFKPDGAGIVPDNEAFEDDELLTITPTTDSMHSWVRRIVSKVTVDFDGTNLKEGVTVYIKNARLMDVPDSAYLGTSPSAAGTDNIKCIPTDYAISYGNGDDYHNWPTITKTHTLTPEKVWKGSKITSFHDDEAQALPCYENMQGEPEGASKLQDSDGNGIIDSFSKDEVTDGTFLEVEGYYVANRPEYQSEGRIFYRFMLGKDAVKNFDLIRNHHYKITMRFKGYGNDIDWHIDYAEKVLDITYPHDVNYQGQFFTPDTDYLNITNAGHHFDGQNVITVTSFVSQKDTTTWIAPEISYTYYSFNDKTGKWDADETSGEWLTLTEGEVSKDNTQKPYTFVASMSDPTPCHIDDLFPTDGVGSETAPYNLSGENGGSTVKNTANCYMVGAPGWYSFPLVYGNAITDGVTDTKAFFSTHIVNHLNHHITKPYIKENAGIDLSNVSVKLIWQDAEDLLTPEDLIYDPTLFGGMGGIKFHLTNMHEGNVVIALIDNNAGEDTGVYLDRGTIYGTSGSTKAIWSWHIWVTRFGFGDFEKNIRITNHYDQEFDVLPVNLGWCSGGNKIIYYKRRKCDITFKIGDREIVRTIEQYPHFILPRGDHPYYQWGRKDPFVGTNLAYGNKPRWTYEGNKRVKYEEWSDYNPPRLYQEPKIFSNNVGRKHTTECLDALVKNPDKWHNSPRLPINPDRYEDGFYSINQSYSDLWSYKGHKTVYDPCPAGYQVADNTVFTGFTTTGRDETAGINWYDVLEENMLPKEYYTGSINSQIIEFYTNAKKLESITFPITGYRDYDGKGEVVKYPNGDFNGECYVWLNVAMDTTNSYHLKFIRKDLGGGDWKTRGDLIAFFEKFYNTDGFAVRPVCCPAK